MPRKPGSKPEPPTEATLAAELAANLRALGVAPAAVGKPAKERIFDAFVELIRETGQLQTYAAVARRARCSRSNVTLAVPVLVEEGRGYLAPCERTGRQTFVPKVTG